MVVKIGEFLIFHTYLIAFDALLKEFLGRIDCTLGEIVGSVGSMIDRPLTYVICIFTVYSSAFAFQMNKI